MKVRVYLRRSKNDEGKQQFSLDVQRSGCQRFLEGRFDLNGTKLRPLDVIAAMKSDPALSSIPTLGYVSHVHTDVIAAARAAGIDEVLARSAFSERLGEILRADRPD